MTWELRRHSNDRKVQRQSRPDALANGDEYRLHGWMLADGHWALTHGVNADWVLGSDDVLQVV